VRSAITDGGGWILDVKLFSNISICFNFEIPPTRLEQLREMLVNTGLRLSDDSIQSLSNSSPRISGPSDENTAGSLQITFIHSEPDLRIQVPPIPG